MKINRFALPTAAALAALVLTACSGAEEAPDTSGTPDRDPSAESSTGSSSTDASTEPPGGSAGESSTPTEAAPTGPVLEVSIAGDKVSPNAVEISLGAGETLSVTVDSDRAGELHVHSKPEQYVEFTDGASEHELVITTPGEVEVEDHETGAVVALIEVK